MEVYFMFTLLGLLSLVFGSFISALTYRLPRGLDFVNGRSFCDSCRKELFWYDNIPVLSFFVYKGKSRCCGKNISIRYLLIEIAALIGTILIWIFFHSVIYVVLFFLTLTIFVIDFEYQLIPDIFTWLVIILEIFFNNNPLFTILFTGFICASLLELLNIVTQGRGMGMGDIKLAIGLGMWLSIIWSLKWLMLSFILGGIFASVLLLLKRANLKTKIAFGPFLIVGFWIIFIISKLY